MINLKENIGWTNLKKKDYYNHMKLTLKSLLNSSHRDVVSLFESPMRLYGMWNPDVLNSLGKNYSFTVAAKEKSKLTGQFKEYDLYQYFDNDKDSINILVKENYTVLFFKYSVVNDIVCEKNIWQESTHIGLARDFIFNYLLKTYKGLMSDDAHTEFGKKYWDKLLKEAITKGYNIVLIDKNSRIPLKSTTDIDKYYLPSPKGLDYKFFISK